MPGRVKVAVDAKGLCVMPKGLFGYNGSVPLGDRFCCENDLLSVLKRNEKGHLYGRTERHPRSQTSFYMSVGQ